jgi:hypothetical protein
METPILGALWLEVPEDELAWAQEINLLQKIAKLKPITPKFVQLNQNRKPEHYYACTYYSTMGAICDVLGYDEATYTRLTDAVVAYGLKTGDYDPKKWAYTAISAKLAVKIHNEMMPTQMSTFKTEIGKSTFYILLNRGYSMAMTYIGWDDYREDIKDGKLDKVDFTSKKWGHSNRWGQDKKMKNLFTRPAEVTALDNYYKINGDTTSGYRRYTIASANIAHLKWEPYFPSAYFFVQSELLK